MTRDRSRLRNFMKKFIGIVRFRNDHFGAIMGYGDYVIGDSVISRVYYVEGTWLQTFFSVGNLDFDLEVALKKTHVSVPRLRMVSTLFKRKVFGTKLIHHFPVVVMMSTQRETVPRNPSQNGVELNEGIALWLKLLDNADYS
ncbi:hypothetical protein Tco_0600076 [Tanacetum coccineum]|uniref:Integrase, catalytic region, zinc finger, CCHC-type, peptidase aspartic, catalytic n=1 Tax=Tanacetum coccineum TaxID=301880 RepID=A0ABQ4WAS2_9ASTR